MTDNRTSDTREKLEEDVERLIGNIQERIFSGRDAGALRFQLRELLDRQAAITERHWMEIAGASASANVELKRQIDELIDLLTDDCGPCYSCAKLAEIVAENSQLRVKVDELVNGNDGETNGIRADVPLVDDLPDGDAVEILRKSAKGFQGGTGNVIKNAKMLLGMNVERGLDIVLLETLADMVERDYVRRAAYNSLKELTTNSDTLTAEQVSKATYAHSIHADCADADWQAIADELNAELVSGTCEPNWVLQGKTQTQEFWRCECGNCGHEFGVETRESFPFKMTIGKVEVPNFCPNCGAMVKKGE